MRNPKAANERALRSSVETTCCRLSTFHTIAFLMSVSPLQSMSSRASKHTMQFTQGAILVDFHYFFSCFFFACIFLWSTNLVTSVYFAFAQSFLHTIDCVHLTNRCVSISRITTSPSPCAVRAKEDVGKRGNSRDGAPILQ